MNNKNLIKFAFSFGPSGYYYTNVKPLEDKITADRNRWLYQASPEEIIQQTTPEQRRALYELVNPDTRGLWQQGVDWWNNNARSDLSDAQITEKLRYYLPRVRYLKKKKDEGATPEQLRELQKNWNERRKNIPDKSVEGLRPDNINKIVEAYDAENKATTRVQAAVEKAKQDQATDAAIIANQNKTDQELAALYPGNAPQKPKLGVLSNNPYREGTDWYNRWNERDKQRTKAYRDIQTWQTRLQREKDPGKRQSYAATLKVLQQDYSNQFGKTKPGEQNLNLGGTYYGQTGLASINAKRNAALLSKDKFDKMRADNKDKFVKAYNAYNKALSDYNAKRAIFNKLPKDQQESVKDAYNRINPAMNKTPALLKTAGISDWLSPITDTWNLYKTHQEYAKKHPWLDKQIKRWYTGSGTAYDKAKSDVGDLWNQASDWINNTPWAKPALYGAGALAGTYLLSKLLFGRSNNQPNNIVIHNNPSSALNQSDGASGNRFNYI